MSSDGCIFDCIVALVNNMYFSMIINVVFELFQSANCTHT